MKAKILLVEDDTSLGYLLSEYLKLKDFVVDWQRNGRKAEDALRVQQYDLCILDVMMPEMDGFQLAQLIRQAYPNLPFLFLTAKSMKIDVLKGLSLGAEDYIKKPVDEEELVLRVEIALRRHRSAATAAVSLFALGKYRYHVDNQQLISPTHTIQLTLREHELLYFFVQRQGQLCDRKEILTRFWGNADYFNRKSMDVFISKLRKYFEQDDRVVIENVHGKGFIFRVLE